MKWLLKWRPIANLFCFLASEEDSKCALSSWLVGPKLDNEKFSFFMLFCNVKLDIWQFDTDVIVFQGLFSSKKETLVKQVIQVSGCRKQLLFEEWRKHLRIQKWGHN